MANDRSMERLERLRETPLYKVSPSGIDWNKSPDRPKIANAHTLLGWTKHDAPIRKAFQFFGLDESDPRHWRVLITYLAMGFFPNPKKDGKKNLKTFLADAELLKRVNQKRDDIFERDKRRATDTELLKAIIKEHSADYDIGELKNLRKKLNAARKT